MFRKFREGREKRREEQEKQRLENERAKWLTVPIERNHSAVDPPPSLEELANRAIQQAGPDVEFDHDAVVAYVYNFCFTRATGIMSRKSLNAIHGLRIIPERDDFEYRMLWDYLTMQGPYGKALHELLAEEIQSDDFIWVVAERIRSGDLCDVDEASRRAGDDADKAFQLGGH